MALAAPQPFAGGPGVAVAVAAYRFGMGSRTPPALARIVVLPMRAYGSDESGDLDRIADEVAESVSRELSRNPELSVVSWPTAATYRAAGKSVPEVSKELGAAYLAAVSALRSSDRLTVSVHLVEGATDRKRWAKGYTFPPKTEALPPDFPGEIASEVLRQLREQPQ
jgi:TolB-like protein